MKGDVASDVTCPLCGWIGHPRRSSVQVQSRHIYVQTPETTARHSIYAHLETAHPNLTVRERSLLVQFVTRGDVDPSNRGELNLIFRAWDVNAAASGGV